MKNVKKYDSAVKSIAKRGRQGWRVGCSSGCLLPVSDRPERRQRVGCRTVHPLGYLQGRSATHRSRSRKRSAQCALKQMQDKARQDTGKDDIYAMSLFKDRDGDVMQNAASICSWFGYTNQGSVFISADGKDVQPATKEGGIHQQALEFLNKAESMGLVDAVPPPRTGIPCGPRSPTARPCCPSGAGWASRV